jgi:hypothetical protein
MAGMSESSDAIAEELRAVLGRLLSCAESADLYGCSVLTPFSAAGNLMAAARLSAFVRSSYAGSCERARPRCSYDGVFSHRCGQHQPIACARESASCRWTNTSEQRSSSAIKNYSSRHQKLNTLRFTSGAHHSRSILAILRSVANWRLLHFNSRGVKIPRRVRSSLSGSHVGRCFAPARCLRAGFSCANMADLGPFGLYPCGRACGILLYVGIGAVQEHPQSVFKTSRGCYMSEEMPPKDLVRSQPSPQPCCICGDPSIGLHSKSARSAPDNFGLRFTHRDQNVVRYFCKSHEQESHLALLAECGNLKS